MAPPATHNSALRRYLDEAGELPRDVLLGTVAFFTVCDGDYDPAQIGTWFEELELNSDFVPVLGKPVDAFRKATSLADKREYPLPDGSTAVVLVRDAGSDAAVIERHLVREVRDAKRRRLSHETLGRAKFFRASKRAGSGSGSERFHVVLDGQVLPEAERPQMTAIAEKITEDYDRFKTTVDGMKIRAMVREYLLYLNAIQLKPSVYFVHVSRLGELERLQQLVARVANGCSMHLMPLPDLDSQREMIVETFQNEAEDSLKEIVKKVSHLRASRQTITPEAYAKVMAEYRAVINRAKEYTSTLGLSQDRTGAAAEAAYEVLVQLRLEMVNAAEVGS